MLPQLPSNATPERMERDLARALATPFPIQGWTFRIELDPLTDEHKFKLYGQKPATDEFRAVTDGEQPVIGEVITSSMKVKAAFKIGETVTLLGKEIPLTKDGMEKQLVTIHCQQFYYSIRIFGAVAKAYSVDTFYPDPAHYKKLVEEWTERLARADIGFPRHAEATYVLAQLNAIRKNSISKLHELLGTLGNLIRDGQPDYWSIVENLLRGKIKPDDAMKIAQGVIDVVPFRPENPASVSGVSRVQ